MGHGTIQLVQGTRVLTGKVNSGGLFIRMILSGNSIHLEWIKSPPTGHSITSMTFKLYIFIVF